MSNFPFGFLHSPNLKKINNEKNTYIFTIAGNFPLGWLS